MASRRFSGDVTDSAVKMQGAPRVCLSGLGRFWAVDLAEALDREGLLTQFYSGHPSAKRAVEGAHLTSYPAVLGPLVLLNRLRLSAVAERLDPYALSLFDHLVARRLKECDVFHALSSMGLHAHRAARERFGALCVCDRANAHILTQQEALRTEYEAWGLRFRSAPPRLIEREIAEYELADLIFVHTSYSRATFLERGVPSDKIVLTPLAVEASSFAPMPKSDGIFRVLFVGTIGPRKGVIYLLQAARELRRSIDIDVCLAGPMDPGAEQILRRFEGCFRYLGVFRRQELARVYSDASVFVLPTIDDGIATVYIEAMRCGLPVISTTSSGAPEIIRDGEDGFIVPPRRPDLLAERIAYLYEHPDERDRLAANARQSARAVPTWRDSGSRIAAIYSEALAKR